MRAGRESARRPARGQSRADRRPSRTVRRQRGASERCDGAMKTRGRAALCWAVLCVCCVGAVAAPRRLYCERADVAWRAYRAPAAFEARVQSLAADAATVQVRRVLRDRGRWLHEDAVVRLKLPPEDLECLGRFEVPLKNRRNYIVFAERRGRTAVALGPPLKRTGKLLKRIRAVYKSGYSECLVILHRTWSARPHGTSRPTRGGDRSTLAPPLF